MILNMRLRPIATLFGTAALIFAAALLTAPSSPPHHIVQKIEGAGSVDWTAGTIEAHGVGFASVEDAGGKEIAKRMAERAAMADAYRQLAETVQGVRVSSKSTLRDLAITEDVVRTFVEGWVRGARVRESHFTETPDGDIQAEVTMEAPIDGRGGFAAALLPYVRKRIVDDVAPEPKKETPREITPPTQSPAPTPLPDAATSQPADEPHADAATPRPEATPASGEITGILFDARGTGYRYTLFPRVVSEDDKNVFDLSMVKNLEEQGFFSPFASSIDEGRKHPKVAYYPVEVKAVSADGITVVISREDAEKLLRLNEQKAYLYDGKILFVIKD